MLNKKKPSIHRQAELIKLATAPASLNVPLIMGQAQSILEHCMTAIYQQNPAHLPMGQMSQQCYLEIAHGIVEGEYDLQGTPGNISLQYIEKDASLVYAVRSVTFEAIISFGEAFKKFKVFFIFDSRTGMTLDNLQKIESTD